MRQSDRTGTAIAFIGVGMWLGTWLGATLAERGLIVATAVAFIGFVIRYWGRSY